MTAPIVEAVVPIVEEVAPLVEEVVAPIVEEVAPVIEEVPPIIEEEDPHPIDPIPEEKVHEDNRYGTKHDIQCINPPCEAHPNKGKGNDGKEWNLGHTGWVEGKAGSKKAK